MKLIIKIIAVLIALYCLCWVALAVYFGYAERHKGMLEDNLSGVFGRTVSIDELQTSWVGWSPSLRIQGLKVQGDIPNQPALAFDSASVVVSPSSLLSFWPRFTEFAVEKPSLEVVTLANNQLQVAGFTLSQSKRPGINREKLFSWLLSQHSAAWHDGEIRWRKSDGSIKRYTDISFLYQRQQQSRSARVTINAPKGKVTAIATTQGDLMSSDDWDASIELLGGREGQLLQPGDLSFDVEQGMGQIRLARLQVERIREFLSLSGLADKARWILDAELTGVLHDLEFTFNGALLNLKDWSLKASATDVGFKSLESLPALNNLSGTLQANAERGNFNFAAENATFIWSRFYQQAFPIDSAKGWFTWSKNSTGGFQVALNNGELTDPNLSIYDLNATLNFSRTGAKVSSFGDLFKVESINELSYQDGDIVVADPDLGRKPLNLDANAKFNVQNVNALSGYVPKLDKIKLFNEWLTQAFKQGVMTNGRASYVGQLSPKAILEDQAKLVVAADFDSVILDYAPKYGWPEFTGGKGFAELVNGYLTITPQHVEFDGDPITNSVITIEDIFSKQAMLKATGKTSVSLDKGLKFLFQGPLVPKDKRPESLPMQPLAGRVDVDLALDLPITDVNNIAVNGAATVIDGSVILPEGVPLSKVNGRVDFTERSVESEKITAQFLGGATQATLVTTERTQPPKMQLKGRGIANVETLKPWVGEHLLSLFDGQAPWRGTLDIDGSNLQVAGVSNLQGVTVMAPPPLAKTASESATLNLAINLGGVALDKTRRQQSIQLTYNDVLKVQLQAEPATNVNKSSLFNRGLIQIGSVLDKPVPTGVNFAIQHPQLDVDKLLESVIDLAGIETQAKVQDTEFLDALRRVDVRTQNATLLGRPAGALNASITTRDGFDWRGQINGDNIQGKITMLPRRPVGKYTLDLDKLVISPYEGKRPEPEPVDNDLRPQDYPDLAVTIASLNMDGRQLGALDFQAQPNESEWKINKFVLVHNGVRTAADGAWTNKKGEGSLSSFDVKTSVEEAEGVLNDMDFNGYIRKGRGSIDGTLSWPGAPDEFDYSRLNGKFDLFMKDGELVQVEPGSGKLLGLLNFNAIARRLVFDFRDVFASGLQFDRMRYRGLIANGEAIFQDAYILTPAVFVRMEGKLDVDKELIDMDVHISPELGGNLTLLSALANPTAGAVVFITSQLFKDDMRRASFKSYQAKGTWKDFEMIEIDSEGVPVKSSKAKNGESTAPKEGADPELNLDLKPESELQPQP